MPQIHYLLVFAHCQSQYTSKQVLEVLKMGFEANRLYVKCENVVVILNWTPYLGQI